VEYTYYYKTLFKVLNNTLAFVIYCESNVKSDFEKVDIEQVTQEQLSGQALRGQQGGRGYCARVEVGEKVEEIQAIECGTKTTSQPETEKTLK
jgi:hypothetical protein